MHLGGLMGVGMISELRSVAALATELARVMEMTGMVSPETTFDGNIFAVVIRRRRARDRIFPANMFADAGWDILLCLMEARYTGRKISVSDLCIASAVPQTTAIRYVRKMTEEGWIERAPDPNDGRRIWVQLTELAVVFMIQWATRAFGYQPPSEREANWKASQIRLPVPPNR